MMYLLGQLVLCLVLAALTGWFIGWSWRGFRDSDRVEDLRRQMLATEEVKDRELAEAVRRADGLQSRLDKQSRGRVGKQPEGASAEPEASAKGSNGSNGSNGHTSAGGPAQVAQLVPATPTPAPAFSGAQADPRALEAVSLALRRELETERRRRKELEESLTGQLREEKQRRRAAETKAAVPAAEAAQDEQVNDLSERLREAEEKLRDKNASAISLQAEVASLRESVERKAGRLAEMESRVLELEPLEGRLAALDQELTEARTGAAAAAPEEASALEALRLEAQSAAGLREQLHELTRQLNEARNRYADTAAELDRQEAALHERGDTADTLRQELDRLKLGRATGDSRWEQQLAARDTEVAALKDRVMELEATLGEATDRDRRITVLEAELRNAERDRSEEIERYRRRLDRLHQHPARTGPDDLTRIRGIGPKIQKLLGGLGIRRFEQIAAWSEADVDHFADELGQFRDRVRWDDWVRQAQQCLEEDSRLVDPDLD